jgi:hypothetical protein
MLLTRREQVTKQLRIRIPLEEQIVPQQVKKFPASHGTPNYIAVFTNSPPPPPPPPVPFLSYTNEIHAFPVDFLKIRFNIILPWGGGNHMENIQKTGRLMLKWI